MKKILISLLRWYKSFLSPVFTNIFGGACRFTPTCSQYTITALEKYGSVRGLKMGIKRLSKCHPWGKVGYDPVS